MKIKILILIAIISLNVNFSFAQSNEIHLFSKPKEVTVYPKGAMVNYQFNVNLKKGINRLIIDSLPSELDKDLILTSLSGENVIVISEYVQNYDVVTFESKAIKTLKDTINNIKLKLNEIKAMIEGLRHEKILLADIKFEQKSDKNNQFKEILDSSPFLSKRISEILAEINKLENTKDVVEEKLKELEFKLEILNNALFLSNNYQVILEVNAESANTSTLNFTYFTSEASWVLTYDLIVDKINEPLKLVYKAMLKQKSGVNWENVTLTFSNKDPDSNKKLPRPNTWLIREDEERYYRSSSSEDNPLSPQINSYKKDRGRSPSPKNSEVYSSVSSNNLNVEFKLLSNITIKSNNQSYGLKVDHREIKASYSHYTYPAKGTKAYIIAQISNWSNLNLIGGEANIYFENGYMGKTNIDPNDVRDTLDIIIGIDKNIAITHELISEMTEDKFFSSNTVQHKGYKIKVKNNSQNKINIKILENYPISASDNIEVKLLEFSNAENNLETGLLTWIKNIEPNKLEELKVLFRLDAPEGFRLKQ